MSKEIDIVVFGGSGFIGKHFLRELNKSDLSYINVDLVTSGIVIKKNSLEIKGSIMDKDFLRDLLLEYHPKVVLNLAAKTVMKAKSEKEFEVNYLGALNILEAIRISGISASFIAVSTQHVIKPGELEWHNTDEFLPHTPYGESKVLMEKMLAEQLTKTPYIILRPTTIWGPGHHHLEEGLWRYIKLGLYFHPRSRKINRSYGYVKNTARQLLLFCNTDISKINGKVFYLADGNFDQEEWLNLFSLNLRGTKIRYAPFIVFKILSVLGDFTKYLGIPFPIYSERLMHLVTPNCVPLEPTFEIIGLPEVDLNRAVEETCSHLLAKGL